MHQSNLVIKQRKSLAWNISIAISILLMFVLTYIFGRYLALEDLSETKAELIEIKQILTNTQEAFDKASERLVMQKQASQVDTLSNQELVNNVKMMQGTQNSLEEELKFYRKIMSPEREEKGLVIDSLLITGTETQTEFHFQVTLIQAGKQTQFIQGDVILTLTGLLGGKTTEYDFRELGTFKPKHFKFQFKYFQNIQGFINLPEGFVAKNLRITAKTKGRRKKQQAEKQMKWQPEESQNYVR